MPHSQALNVSAVRGRLAMTGSKTFQVAQKAACRLIALVLGACDIDFHKIRVGRDRILKMRTFGGAGETLDHQFRAAMRPGGEPRVVRSAAIKQDINEEARQRRPGTGAPRGDPGLDRGRLELLPCARLVEEAD